MNTYRTRSQTAQLLIANNQSEGEQNKNKKAKTALFYDDPVIRACKEEFDEHQGPGWEGLVGQKVCAGLV